MSRIITILFALCSILFAATLSGQNTHGGVPYGLMPEYRSLLSTTLKINKTLELSALDINNYEQNIQGTPLFAIPMSISKDVMSRVVWQEIEEQQVGWVRIKLNDPSGISLLLSDLDLKAGERIFFYDIDGRQVHGAYTLANNKSSKRFLSEIVKGEEIIIEIVRLAKSERKIPFKLKKMYKVIDNSEIENQSMEVDTGFMASLPCHQNINCTIGNNVQTEKRGVMRVMMVLEEGLGWCTGALMNNTNEDRAPLVLSAYHCQDGYTPLYDLWRFDFNFETNNCDDPSTRPSYQALQGCSFLAGVQETDFILLRINTDIPAGFNVYYNGWDRRNDYEPTPTKFIHHPAGDIKKVAEDTDDLRVWASATNWNNDTTTPAGSHLRVELENGNHEPGSSGGPLFDAAGRVIGQLHGGNTNEECTLSRAYFGRLSVSWEIGDMPETRLVDWLDPTGTGALQLDGIDGVDNSSMMALTGTVVTTDGTPLGNVLMELTGDVAMTQMTDAQGNYSFNDLPEGGDYILGASKNTMINNGVTVTDMTLMIRHILGLDRFTSEVTLRAGDVNGNGSISVTDLVEVQNVILGLKDKFSKGRSWGFFPGHIQIENGQFDPASLSIIGYKRGDVNYSADPEK